jgi:Protein of unknown function (DUF2889)
MRASDRPEERPIWPGTIGPATSTPARAIPSVRRTTTVDVVFGQDASFTLIGAGRDLVTTSEGDVVVDEASTRVEVNGRSRETTAISVAPSQHNPAAQALIGLPAGGKFRKALVGCLPDQVAQGTLLAQLLDDTPAISLVGMSSIARRNPDRMKEVPLGPASHPPIDVCSGWKADGLMIRARLDGSKPYLGEGPPVTALHNGVDPLAWHVFDKLPIGGMRRHRRIDIAYQSQDNTYTFDLFFRDSYVEPNGTETAVHEYEIVGAMDHNLTIVDIRAVPRVLPGPECPVAAGSAQRLIGLALGEVRSHVTGEFSGVSTCTHLNDALRSLGAMHTFNNWFTNGSNHG